MCRFVRATAGPETIKTEFVLISHNTYSHHSNCRPCLRGAQKGGLPACYQAADLQQLQLAVVIWLGGAWPEPLGRGRSDVKLPTSVVRLY